MCQPASVPNSSHILYFAIECGESVVEIHSEMNAGLTCTPKYIRSDNGPEFVAKSIRRWLKISGVQTLYIEPGSPWENGYIGSFNGKFRDELLNREIFDTLFETKVLVNRWKKVYNTIRPHSSGI
jgi:transposase InsO family protein